MLIECFKSLFYWMVSLILFLSTTNCYCQVVVEEEIEESEADGCYITVNPACANVVGRGVFPESGPCTEIKCFIKRYWETDLWIKWCTESTVEYSAADSYSDTIDAGKLGLIGNRVEKDMEDKFCGVSVFCSCLTDRRGIPKEFCESRFGAVTNLPALPVPQKRADLTSPLCPDDDGDGDGAVDLR